MAKDVINIDGQDTVVREDTAKAFRGVNWMIIVLISFVVIVGVVTADFFIRAASVGTIESPAQIQNTNTGGR